MVSIKTQPHALEAERYEVHTYTLCEGWINCWTISDETGQEKPLRFASVEAAEAEIKELILDIRFEIDNGQHAEHDAYILEDYRVYDRAEKIYLV